MDDIFEEYTETDLVSQIYQQLVIATSTGEFIAIAMRFQDLVNEKRIIKPSNQMMLSSLLMSKQNDLAIRELYGKVETVMNIFEPDRELLTYEEEIQEEEEFEGENIVSLKNWMNKKGKE